MQDSLMQQGLDLLVFGMGTVFVFLALLVLTTHLMSWLVSRFEQPAVPVPPAAAAAGAGDSELVAVISAAIHKHRSRRRQ